MYILTPCTPETPLRARGEGGEGVEKVAYVLLQIPCMYIPTPYVYSHTLCIFSHPTHLRHCWVRRRSRPLPCYMLAHVYVAGQKVRKSWVFCCIRMYICTSYLGTGVCSRSESLLYSTRWRRCFKLQVSFHKRATTHRLFRGK